jgi:hypothetical protein
MPIIRPEKLRRRRRPTIASVLRQASKADVPIKRVRIEPDGAVTLDVGEPDPTEASNPWLAEIERTRKQ